MLKALKVIYALAPSIVALVVAATCLGIGGSKFHPGLGWLLVGAIVYVECKTAGRDK